MKAAVFYGPGGAWPQVPMEIEDVERPVPGRKQLLIKVAACGVCRTDLEYLKGKVPVPKGFPIILGHEPAGTVVEVGAEVQNFKSGQRVLVVPTVPCKECALCRSGHENLCSKAEVIGASRDGAFAEYLVAPAHSVYPLPDDLPLEESAVITDAVGTSYHAIYDLASIKPGDTVAIYGASGGLGLVCVQMASSLGATVIGIGRKRWKLEKAKELGASEIISTEEIREPEREVNRLTGIGADVSLDVSGVPSMVESGFRSTRPGGRMVVVGFSSDTISLAINRLVWYELNIIGCRVYQPMDLNKAIKVVQSGIVNLGKIVSHRFKLEEINEAYQMLDRGEILRAIVTL